jgi:multicomponent Na+:H+ antiporter subunit D
MTGKSKFTELGGLYKKMPLAFLFTLIGGLSISAFPLFSGFVSKSMIVAAGFNDHLYWAAFLLTLASAGTFLHTGLKVPYFIWFGKNNCSQETWDKAADPPLHMHLAMGIAAFLCIFIGVYTPYLYNMLPYAVDYQPYTAYHLSEAMQILLFTALGFFLFIKKLTPEPVTSLDLDWFYRMGGQVFQITANRSMNHINRWGQETLAESIPHRLNRFFLEGPARLCLLVVKPIWQLTGVRIDGPEGAERRFLETFNRSLFTIGSNAIFTVVHVAGVNIASSPSSTRSTPLPASSSQSTHFYFSTMIKDHPFYGCRDPLHHRKKDIGHCGDNFAPVENAE